jgi:hypothetical protein
METTLNIRADILEQITSAANSNSISCSEMIALLIQQVTADIAEPVRIGRMVQYQGRRSSQDWHVFHVQVREDMYEYWLDLRKLLKMSVSLILAYAVKKFLCKLMKINSTDNYLCKNYIIIKEVIDSVIVWKFIWGYPPDLGKLVNHKTSNS